MLRTMPDNHSPYSYPTPVLLYPVLGSFLGVQTHPSLAAMQPNGLACRNSAGDYVKLPVYCRLRLS